MSSKSEIAKILGMTVEETEVLSVIRLANEVTTRLYKDLLTPAEREVAQAMGISFGEACKAKYKGKSARVENAMREVERLEKMAKYNGAK
jgi:hypothetical protein